MTEYLVEHTSIQCDRGARLALQRIRLMTDGERHAGGEPVLLTHGTFSNHRTCTGLARYLAARGFDCWLLDYEGHGNSDRIRGSSPDFESLFLAGSEAALRYVADETDRRVHWVGHSGGGLALLMSLSRTPSLRALVQRVVLAGSQACDAADTLSKRMLLRAFGPLTRLLRHVPGPLLGLGPENEPASVMLQWYGWNIRGQWMAADGFDYVSELASLDELRDLPVLTLAGSGDHFIAPVNACQRLHDTLPSHEKLWLECGIRQGYSEDYNHARLISSRTASREIWPQIADWLDGQPTRQHRQGS